MAILVEKADEKKPFQLPIKIRRDYAFCLGQEIYQSVEHYGMGFPCTTGQGASGSDREVVRETDRIRNEDQLPFYCGEQNRSKIQQLAVEPFDLLFFVFQCAGGIEREAVINRAGQEMVGQHGAIGHAQQVGKGFAAGDFDVSVPAVKRMPGVENGDILTARGGTVDHVQRVGAGRENGVVGNAENIVVIVVIVLPEPEQIVIKPGTWVDRIPDRRIF